MLQKMYNYELTKSLLKVNRKTNGISEEDLNFMQVLDNGARVIDGHYEIALPLRDDMLDYVTI